MAGTVKSSFKWQDNDLQVSWNGKIYGTKCYVEAGNATVTLDTKTGTTSVNKGRSLDFARAALASLNVAPFNGFDFSPR